MSTIRHGIHGIVHDVCKYLLHLRRVSHDDWKRIGQILSHGHCRWQLQLRDGSLDGLIHIDGTRHALQRATEMDETLDDGFDSFRLLYRNLQRGDGTRREVLLLGNRQQELQFHQ